MSDETDNVEAAAEAPEVVTNSEAFERPEWLPEKFNTPEDLVSSYSALESKLGKGDEELRESIMSEIEAEAFSNRPESAGDYELPEGLDNEWAEDPNVEWWSNFAWENGFSQEEFEEGLSRFLPDGPDLEAELQKLGDNANARIETVALWAQKNIPETLQDEVMRLGETADGIQLLEHLMSSMNDESIGGQDSMVSGLSKGDLETMMRDPRYWDNSRRDPAFVKQVDEGFSKLYK
jgi:hypothetical protein